MLKHGTASTYSHAKCRCRPCVEAHTTESRRRRRLIAEGKWEGLVDPAPVREHIKTLTAAGMSQKLIAAQSGVSADSLARITSGRATKVHAVTEAAILGTRVSPRRPSSPVDPTGTMRRLQSLQLAGWLLTELQGHSGINRTTLQDIVNGRKTHIRADTHDRVIATTRHLDRTSAPRDSRNDAASRAALERGWVDLAAWDDVDNPAETPKGIPHQGEPKGPPRVEDDVITTIHRLHRAGLTDRAIADHLGYASTSAIQKLRHRHREEDAA